ncbi:hypothetical protein TNCV_3946061 [Trichonephila clavipes]|nr:hypothetical protein TNCV_3946061 [Trichonephila clavipes]
MDNRNEPTDMDLIDSPRRTPTPPPLSACEQILQKQSPAAKMETFKSSSWPASLNFKPCPITTRMSLSTDVPFRELQEVEETINLAPLGGTAVLKNKRSQIPTLNCATGMAVTDPQKANLLANTIKNNFIENNRMQDNYDQDDEVVTSTVNTFFSSPFYSN